MAPILTYQKGILTIKNNDCYCSSTNTCEYRISWGDRSPDTVLFIYDNQDVKVPYQYKTCGPFTIRVNINGRCSSKIDVSSFIISNKSQTVFSNGSINANVFDVLDQSLLNFTSSITLWNGDIISNPEYEYEEKENKYTIYFRNTFPISAGDYKITLNSPLNCSEENTLTVVDTDPSNVKVIDKKLYISSILPETILFDTLSIIDFGDESPLLEEIIPSRKTGAFDFPYNKPGIYHLEVKSTVASSDGTSTSSYIFKETIIIDDFNLQPIISDEIWDFNVSIPLATFTPIGKSLTSTIKWNDNIPIEGIIDKNKIYSKWVPGVQTGSDPFNNIAVVSLIDGDIVSVVETKVSIVPFSVSPMAAVPIANPIANPVAVFITGFLYGIEPITLTIEQITWNKDGIQNTAVPTITSFLNHTYNVTQDFFTFEKFGQYTSGEINMTYGEKYIFQTSATVNYQSKGGIGVEMLNPKFKVCRCSRRLLAIINQSYDSIIVQYESGRKESPEIIGQNLYITHKFRSVGEQNIYLYLYHEGFVWFYSTTIYVKCKNKDHY